FEHAKKLVVLSFDEIKGILPILPDPSPLIVIANPARSGSTLLQHMLNQVNGVVSLGEPNPALYVRYFRDIVERTCTHSEAEEMLSWSIRLLTAPWAGQTVVLKLRASEMPLLSLLHELRPDAKTIMIYRDAFAVGASWKNQASNWETWGSDFELEEVSSTFLSTKQTQETIRRWMNLSSLDRVPQVIASLSLWMTSMESYLLALEDGMSALTVRYDDLINQPDTALKKLFSYLELDHKEINSALAVMSEDSQLGTVMARKNGLKNQSSLNDDEMRWINEALALHPMGLSAEMELAGAALS
ncbi:MAG: sulfotransferase, partial [Pseudomonadales bacterium]